MIYEKKKRERVEKMKVLSDIEKTDKTLKAIALGMFDGVHLGHQELIKQMVNYGEEKGYTKTVMSFSEHPKKRIVGKVPRVLTSIEEKRKKMEALKVELLILQNFTEDFSKLSPEEFVHLLKRNEVKAIFVGFNFRFGKKGMGDSNLMKELGKKLGIEVVVIPPVEDGKGRVISSTLIRKELEVGNTGSGVFLLGEGNLIEGIVVRGKRIARQLGFPTANIKSITKIEKKKGVYGGHIKIQGEEEWHPCVINNGYNPTLKPGEKSFEAHIINFNRDIYDKKVVISIEEFIRDEKKFENIDELKEEIKRNCEHWIKEVGDHGYTN